MALQNLNPEGKKRKKGREKGPSNGKANKKKEEKVCGAQHGREDPVGVEKWKKINQTTLKKAKKKMGENHKCAPLNTLYPP